MTLERGLAVPPTFDADSGYLQIADDRLAAYDLTTGTPRWVAPVRLLSSPVVGDGLVFVEQLDSLTALRAGEGAVAWQIPLGSRLSAPPSWTAGSLVAATGASVFAVRTADGTVAWRRDIPGLVHASPAAAGDGVYVPTSDGRVLALRASTGEMLWERRLGTAAHGLFVADERLFLGAVDNFFYCLSARDGQTEWRWRTGADVLNLPVVDRSRVYFVSLDNVVRALNQRNGVQQWKRGLQFRPAFAPVRAADTLLLTGLDGPPRAFLLKDGLPAGEMTIENGSEMAAPLHTFQAAGSFGPSVLAITRRLVSGAAVTTVTVASRSIDPPVLPTLAPLPGLIPMTAPPPR